MHRLVLPFALMLPAVCAAQQAAPAASSSLPIRSEFHIRYVNGNSVYIDGGRSSGLTQGAKLILKQSAVQPSSDNQNAAIAPGVIARLTVVAVASTSAVCQVDSTTRSLVPGDVVSLPQAEVEDLVEKNALGNTRTYPMVVSFTSGDPLDDEVRDAVPHPPLPEINESRGRVGFDMSTIRGIGQGASTSSTYGMVVRAEISRIHGTHWNLMGYWRGSLQKTSTQTQPTLQDLINRTYQMSLTYVNPTSNWTAGVGRLYLPWASSLEVIDGGYIGRKFASGQGVVGAFGGSTPDPTAWNYSPNRQIAGAFVNMHGGSFEHFWYTSTAGFGVNLLSWNLDRPFVFTENDFSFKRIFSLYHSMQIDSPAANPSTPAVGVGIGQSLLSVRAQIHSRVSFDFTQTYFRDVPTYDPALVGTGLLDAYLFQGINGGARVEFPWRLTGYFSVGRSNSSTDTGSSLNAMFGATLSNIWKTGLQVDAHYSKFDSGFATGSYRTLTISRDVGEHLRLNLQGGKQAYTSSLATVSSPYFANLFVETNLGPRYFWQSAYTTQRGGTQDYDQWTNTFGFRFDNRALKRRFTHAGRP